MMEDLLLFDLADQVRNRFYGKYRGTVIDVDATTFRIKAQVPAVLGEQASGWAVACVPYAGKGVGLAFLPEKGTGVWIEFENGDVSFPIWTGCYWRDGELPEGAKPTVKCIATPGKFKLLVDDDEGKAVLSDGNGNEVTLSADGIVLQRGSQKVAIGDSGVSVNDGALEVK